MLTLIDVEVKEDPARSNEGAKAEQESNKDPNAGSRFAKASVRVHRFTPYLVVGDRVDPFKPNNLLKCQSTKRAGQLDPILTLSEQELPRRRKHAKL